MQERIADNTFGKVLPRLAPDELMACLHRLVKAEHRRGNLEPTRLPRGTVAIDGKNVATLHWHDMLRVLKLNADETTVEQGTTLFARRYSLALVDELKAAYGRSKLFSLVTTDAGNTSCGVGGRIVELGLDYFAQLKSPHGEIHAEAEHFLLHLCASNPETMAFDCV